MNAHGNVLRRRRLGPSGSWAAIVFLLSACLTAGLTVARAAEVSEQALKPSLEAEFRIIPLRDGVLLEPREEIPDVAAVEVSDGNVAIDGEALGEDEVRTRLGTRRGNLVLQLAALSDEQRQEVLFGRGTGTEEESAAEAEETTENEAGNPSEPGEAEGLPQAPRPPRPPRPSRVHSDEKVVLGNSLHVEAGETVQDVVVMGGSLSVDGTVDGDAVVIGGPGTVNGEVTGDFVVVGGPAKLGPEAHIHGDVALVGGSLSRDPNAVIDGEVSHTQLPLAGKWWSGWAHDWARQRSHPFTAMSPFRRVTRVFYTVTRYLLLVLLAMLLMLIARRPMKRVAARVTREPWKAGVVGFLAEVLFLPVTILVVVLLAISIIGIPLLILVPFALLALAFGAFFGYCAVAWALGRWLRERLHWNIHDSYLQLVLGFAGLAVLAVTGRLIHIGPLSPLAVLFLVIGAVLNYLAWTAGFGAVLMSRFGTSGPNEFPPEWTPPTDEPPMVGEDERDLPLAQPASQSPEPTSDDAERGESGPGQGY